MIELRCKKCGSVLTNQEEIYICCACGARYEKESASSYTEELARILDEQKQEAVANLRMQLWREFNEEFYDLEEIKRLARGIKSYLPDDFFANFCDFASERNSRSLSKFLLKTDVVKYKDYVWDMLNFLMRPLRKKNLMAVNELLVHIREAELDKDKFNYYNKLLIKKSKEIDEGVYDATLPRDVFVAYSSADMEKVEELVETLEGQNIRCFVATRNLQHGAIQHYEDQLKTAMDSCKTVVFVSSSNSRDRDCDALTVELAYIKQKDKDAAPGVYRNDYEKMPKEYKKPRVEYLISEHENTVADRLVEEFFAGYEYCYDVETVAERILEFIATPAMGNIKYCVACGAENLKRTRFCSDCGGKEFALTKEEYEERQRIKQERALREAEAVRKAEEDRLRTEEEKKKAEAEAATLRAELEAFRKAEEERKKTEADRLRIEEEKKRAEAEAATLWAELERLKAEIGKTMTNADGDGVGVKAKKIEDKPVAQTETTYAKPSVAPYPKASPASDFIIGNGEPRKYVGKGAVFGIPDGVTSLGNSVFGGCSSLTSITIPNSVTSIGNWAFQGCSGLTSITIPNSVSCIGCRPFDGCSGLTSIKVDKGNKKYHSAGNCLIETKSKSLIAGCNNSIIPTDGSVTSIEEWAFSACSGLTSITIPNSVTSIGGGAFYGCSGLTSITIPDGVTSLGNSVFGGCSSLTSITIPDSVTSIGNYAFKGCSGLTSITIPNSVTEIGERAFSGCPAKIYCHRKKPLFWPKGWDKSLKGRIIWDT